MDEDDSDTFMERANALGLPPINLHQVFALLYLSGCRCEPDFMLCDGGEDQEHPSHYWIEHEETCPVLKATRAVWN